MDRHTVIYLILVVIGSSSAQLLPCRPIINNDTVSPECMADYNTACEARLNLEPWALVMFDSNGREESGKFYGNLIYLGDYKQCVEFPKQLKRVELNPIQEELHFCVAFWLGNGHGLCIPGSCSSTDFLTILQREYSLTRPTLVNASFSDYYCVQEKDIGSDAAAIISIVILCLFGFIVIAATLYDKMLSCCNSPKVAPQSSHTAVLESGKSGVCAILTNKGFEEGAHESEGNEKPVQSGKNMETHPINTLIHLPGSSEIEAYSNSIISNGHVNSAWDVRRDEHEAHNHIKGDEASGSSRNASYPKVFQGVADADAQSHLRTKSRNDVHEPNSHVSHQQVKKNKGGTVAADVLLAFSLYKNFPKLTSAKPPKVNYGCVNGLRFLSMVGVILGHTYALGAVAGAPIENIIQMLFIQRPFTFEVIHQLTLVVDTFFILRLTPVYAIILMVYTNLFTYFKTSPLIPSDIPDIDNCKQYWWGNLLYINNFFPPEKECFSLSWYLATDMQLYLVLPLFVAPLVYAEHLRQKRDRHTKVVLVLSLTWVGLAICGSLISRIYLFHEFYNGNPEVHNIYDIYYMPWARAAVYFMAVYLGYFTYRTKGEVTIHPVVVGLGWLVAMACIGMSFYLPYLTSLNCASSACGFWTVAGNTAFSALQRPMFALGIIWIIFACLSGYGDIVNSILSWNFWNPLARLTYVGYLIHMMVLDLYLYSSTVQLYVSHLMLSYFFAGSLLFTMCLSMVVSLVFEAPMMGIEKVALSQRKLQK